MVALTDSARAALLDSIARVLPQTQCRRCGFAGCEPYAAALVDADAAVSLCPPGGQSTREALVALLGRDDPDAPPLPDEALQVARVREEDCIGCTRCIDACPVDAIVGAAGRMHTVVSAWCTGCSLCVPVCPTDCLVLEASATHAPSADRAADARARHARLIARLTAVGAASRGPALVDLERDAGALRDTVAAALARRRAADGVRDP